MEPFSLHIGPVVYDVQVVPQLRDGDGDRMAGTVTHDTEQVQIDASLPKRSQHITVMHELLHTIFQQAGQREWYKEEGLLDCIAYGLVGARVEGDDGARVPLLAPLFIIMLDEDEWAGQPEGSAECTTAQR